MAQLESHDLIALATSGRRARAATRPLDHLLRPTASHSMALAGNHPIEKPPPSATDTGQLNKLLLPDVLMAPILRRGITAGECVVLTAPVLFRARGDFRFLLGRLDGNQRHPRWYPQLHYRSWHRYWNSPSLSNLLSLLINVLHIFHAFFHCIFLFCLFKVIFEYVQQSFNKFIHGHWLHDIDTLSPTIFELVF